MKNRISLAIFLLLMHLCAWAQIGGDYNPTNPSDPGNPTQEYTLTLKASPTNGGSFNTTSTNIAGGKTYNLRAYPSTDFAFVAWLCNGDTLSKSSSYTYTMPYHDVEIIGVFTYSPSSPSDPNVVAQKYTLTLKATPSNGGSFNTTSAKVSVGERYNLRAYPNTDFAFVAWLCEGDTLSKSASYDYTMPSQNVDITGVFTYRPSSPSDPQEQALKYQLSLTATPMNSGSFNISNERLAVGSNNSLRAYANTDFVFKRWMIGDSVLSTNPNMDFVMPAHNVQMVGVFEYNPASPANPNRNHWDKQTGEVIVDDFTPGSLSSAISSVISGSSSNDVQMIIVSGRITSNDFGIANNYKNCSLLDLSRVTGVTEVPSYAFDYTNLETVYLPATIEKISARAFAECTKLSSLTIYAMTPPTLESQVFQGVPEGLVIYVPAAAIAQYQDIEEWGKFTLLPIQEDIRSISISLPEGANASDYTQMWLELTNTKSGQRMHYVMTDRTQYTFGNIIRNTSWNVTLRNERGDVFGQIDNVEVKDEDVSVTFSTLSKPQSVILSVLTPDGQDVTALTQVTWTDAQGQYMTQGVSLTGLPAGYQTAYRIVLQQELAMAYNTPQPVDYVLTDGDNRISCQLTAIPQAKITGKVKDASTGLALSGAVVSASQTFGGKYSKTLNAKTDNNGVYTLDVFNVPTSVAFAATDYVSQTVNCDSLLTGAGEVTLPDVLLKTITGATITLGFTYTLCDGETQNWYSDYQNVGYELFNVTKNKAVNQYNVQYPQIVLMEEVSDGDVLRLTATSRTNAFMPVTATATIDEQKAETTFAVVELGKIQSSFTSTGNAAVVGSLYDASGKLVKTYDYANASLTISNLADGNYTLVTMGNSRLFNTIYDLSQLPQTGLIEGTDYVVNPVEVKSGVVSEISISEVPTLDESKLYYTGDNTSFTVNKPSIVAGNYLTLTGRIDFKQAYATSVSNVQMIVDLPESCEFVENSVMVGNSTSSYTLNGNRITIPMTRYTDRVRFCIIPTLGGDYAPSAFVQFDLNGETVTQPIGSANYTANDLSISVPSTVAKTAIPVSGTAIGTSNIKIYDNGVLIGQTTSLANGTWATTCELNEPYNLSTHSLYAKVTTKQGIELQSDTKDLTYDMNAIQIQKVTMYHYNPEMHTTFESVFDFQNPHTTPNQWTVYYPNKKFTYTVDFTNNSPEKVSNVILYVHAADGKIVPLYPTYDEKKDTWVADIDMGNRSDGYYPVNVSVDFDVVSDVVLDAELFEKEFNSFSDSQTALSEYISEFEEVYAKWENAVANNDDEGSAQYLDSLIDLVGYANTDISADRLDEDSIQALIAEMKIYEDSLANVTENILNASLYDSNIVSQYFDGVIVLTTEGLTLDQILTDGFDKVAKTDSTYYYILYDESGWRFVDFDSNLYIIANTQTSSLARIFRANSESTDWAGRIKELGDNLNKVVSSVQGILDGVVERLYKLNEKNGELLEEAQKKWATRYVDGLSSSEIKSLEKDMAKYAKEIKRNDGIALWIEKNLKQYMSGASKTSKVAGKAFSLFALGMDAVDGINKVSKMTYLRDIIEAPCEEAESAANKLTSDVNGWVNITGGYYVAKLISDIAEVGGISGGIAGLIPSGGTSTAAIAAAIAVIVANIAAEAIFNNRYDNAYNKFEARYGELYKLCKRLPCDGETPCPPPSGGDGESGGSGGSGSGGGTGSGSTPDNVRIDPSGYVYEGVFSNRVEGATATAYYKEMVEDMYGDLHENIVKWDAEEYAQENPLFTDESGYYRWDVPQGLWQVKFEKEGYETTYSEWLPVPPPQLDVNIPMKQNAQPSVKAARAYEDAVEVEFDKYMMPELLNVENIMVMQNGTAVEGSVELLNEEASYEGEAETFASKIRFNAAEPFAAEEVTLLVNNRVKSYAGIRMQDDYQQTFAVEQEIRQIVSDSVVTVGYGNASTLTVSVPPASASKGKTLTVKTSSPIILGVETEQVTIGNDGKAEITVTGELPGTAALTFSVEGTDKTAMTIASVEQVVIKTVATPKASIASGTVVDMGAQIALSCETEGVTIYYTIDGSCPCDNSGSRIKYDGTPIVINEGVTIKVIAVASDGTESDVAEFFYITKDEEDEIITIPAVVTNTKEIYDISGRKAGRKTKGIIIQNNNGTNRKVLIK